MVIPVRNEAKSIVALIKSIQTQTRRPDEVIIVDGGSTDGTPELIRALVRDDPTVQIVVAGTATPGRGRNVGRSVARNPWIAFTDGGIELDDGWLQELVDAAERGRAEIVFGTYRPQIRSFRDSCALGAYIPARKTTPSGFFRGPFVASSMVTSKAFDDAGGFPDLRAAEELIFFEHVERNRVPATLACEAMVYWDLPPSVAAIYRKFWLYSRQNVISGRQRYWHYGVARIYAVGVIALAIGLARDRRAALLMPLGVLARASHNLWKHRTEFGLAFVLNPFRIVGVAGLTLVIDAATFAGWASASLRRLRRWPHRARVVWWPHPHRDDKRSISVTPPPCDRRRNTGHPRLWG